MNKIKKLSKNIKINNEICCFLDKYYKMDKNESKPIKHYNYLIHCINSYIKNIS